MDNEKKYNEALERARDYYKANLKLGKADENLVLEDIFPELAESKNEKIRKAIRGWIYTRPSQFFDGGFSKEEMLAWLEKQGEQKPIDNVESKDYSSIDPHFGKPIDKMSADKLKPFDEYEGLTDFERAVADICIGYIGKECGWKQYIKDNADILLKIAIKKFNSIQDVPFEQNSAWSEDDERERKRIIGLLEGWLSTFKETCYAEDCKCGIDWLQSLKDRYAWKPSEEQKVV